MDFNVEDWLIYSLYCDTAPEFRAAYRECDEAYSGPEQRGWQLQLQRASVRSVSVADTKPDTALAA